MATVLRHAPLAVILALYFGFGCWYAVAVPDWQAPDEPAHVTYVDQLADGDLPRLSAADYDQALIDRVVFEEGFAEPFDRSRFAYQDWQPPLYYAFLAPVAHASDSSLLVMRLASVALGAVTVAFAYCVACIAAPGRPAVAVATAGLLLVPQNVAISASVNNDALANLLVAGGLLVSVKMVTTGSSRQLFVILGLVTGAGLLTKVSAYPPVAVAFLAVVLAALRDHTPVRSAIGSLALVGGISLAMALPWWMRNFAVYGWPDFLGLDAIRAAASAQPRTADAIERDGFVAFARQFVETSFKSAWGYFGWLTVPMSETVYRALGLLTALAGVFAVGGWLKGRPRPLPGPVAILCCLLIMLVFVQYLGYNAVFVQHQGRYFFPALPAVGLLASRGLDVWVGQRFGAWPWLVVAGMAALNLYALAEVLPVYF
jgi:4-amino-4-deoxy-L-arabinose transferase-like glycosyltransferase